MRRYKFLFLSLVALALALPAPNGALAGPPRGIQIVKEYRKALSAAKGNLAQTVAVHLDFAVRATEEAKEANNPNYMGFTGGADNVQYLQEAKSALAELESAKGATDPEVVRMTAQYEETHAKVAAICAAFNEDKLKNQTAPEDLYKGSDRKELEKMIRAEWTKLYPEDQILSIRFHMTDWERNQEHQWQAATQSWRDVDMSVLAVSVIVKTSETIATTYPAYANKDNLSGGKLTIGAETKGDGYVHREILVANL